MVGYDDANNALTLGDDDSLEVGDYELKYNSTDNEWHAEYGRPIGGEDGAHGDIKGAKYSKDSQIGENSVEFSNGHTIEVPDNTKFDETTTFSISGWFKAESYNSDFRIFSKYDFSRDAGYSLQNQGANGLSLLIGDGTRNRVDLGDISNNPPTGQWHHLVGTYDGSTMRLYINNVEEDTTSISTTVDVARVSGFIGGTGGTVDYNGNIDDVRFYNKTLSPSEVDTLFNGGNVSSSLVARWNFEFPETPDRAIDSTGDPYPQNSVPRSTSGSLVPQGLAESVSAGEALADDGNTYTSVQTAVDNATGWVFIGPGTFNENVTVSTGGLTIEGSGKDTLIDGGTSGDAINLDGTSPDVTIRNLSVQTTAGGGTSSDGITVISGSSDCHIENVHVRQSDRFGIDSGADRLVVTNCRIESTDDNGVNSGSGNVHAVVTNNFFADNDYSVMMASDDSVVSNNYSETSRFGIVVNGNDCLIGGNRINGTTAGDCVTDNGTDNIIYNNRLSDATAANLDISNNTGGVTDANLTGASN